MDLRRILERGLMALWFFAVAMGCGSSAPRPPVPKVEDYDRSCAQDSDCAATFVGDIGCCFQCENAAVRVSELDRVSADDLRASECRMPTPPPCDLSRCRETPAVCIQGTCQLHQAPPTLSLSNYDRSCTTVLDCSPVFFSEAPSCCGRHCRNAAVRRSAVELLTFDTFAPLDCSDAGCDDAGPSCDDFRVSCTSGLCQLRLSTQDGGAPHDGPAGTPTTE